MLDADYANKIVDFLNGLLNAKVTPSGVGKFVFSANGMTLDLAQQKATSPAGTPDLSAIQAQVSALQGQVAAITQSLRNATITAVCNEDGTITVTLTFPALP